MQAGTQFLRNSLSKIREWRLQKSVSKATTRSRLAGIRRLLSERGGFKWLQVVHYTQTHGPRQVDPTPTREHGDKCLVLFGIALPK
jgi:hypothetical protein